MKISIYLNRRVFVMKTTGRVAPDLGRHCLLRPACHTICTLNTGPPFNLNVHFSTTGRLLDEWQTLYIDHDQMLQKSTPCFVASEPSPLFDKWQTV